MDGNNQYNQGQYGGNQYYGGQPNMNQNNQYDQPGMNQYGQPQMGYQQPMAGGMNTYNYAKPNITLNEYGKDYAEKGTKSNITTAAVCLYICFAINFFGSFIAAGDTNVILDCVLILALGLCIQILKSRIASVVALIYGIINVALYLIWFGQLGGILLPIAGVCACIGTFKLAKEYKEYTGR